MSFASQVLREDERAIYELRSLYSRYVSCALYKELVELCIYDKTLANVESVKHVYNCLCFVISNVDLIYNDELTFSKLC